MLASIAQRACKNKLRRDRSLVDAHKISRSILQMENQVARVHCLFDKLLPISKLRLNPDNRNKHPKDQIERLAQILRYQGWRYAVKVSNQSGMVTAGHGRIEAARLNGWTEVPVVFQDYETSDQELADTISDNAIAGWAELDLAGINFDIEKLGPDFEIDMLGIESFELDPPLKEQSEVISEGPEEHVGGSTKVIIHLTDHQHLAVMRKVQTCCRLAEIHDLSDFFVAAVDNFLAKLEAESANDQD